MSSQTCPDCNGKGSYTALVCPGGEWRESACTACGGTGQVTEEHLRKIEEGRAMRDARRARRVSQSERAQELGMDVVKYSRLENGRL